MNKQKDFRQRWHAYYSRKRISHQWFQVDLLKDLPVQNVLEVGPYLGLVTAMLASAGYSVTTFDIESVSHDIGAEKHIQGDISKISKNSLCEFDAILCCEILEHIAWEDIDSVINRMAEGGAPWLIISVPYEGFQFGFSIYLNRFQIRRSSFFRKLRFMKNFKLVGNEKDWEPHKWEIGYRHYSIRAFSNKIKDAGYKIERQEFTSGCRSVFFVCKNTLI